MVKGFIVKLIIFHFSTSTEIEIILFDNYLFIFIANFDVYVIYNVPCNKCCIQ